MEIIALLSCLEQSMSKTTLRQLQRDCDGGVGDEWKSDAIRHRPVDRGQVAAIARCSVFSTRRLCG